jgi:hypothetical protein
VAGSGAERPPGRRRSVEGDHHRAARGLSGNLRSAAGARRAPPRPGRRCGRKRVARLMRTAGLVGVCHRRKHRRAGPAPAVHADLVQRRFVAEAPDRLWVTDLTEHSTAEGKVYCAAVLDVFSRVVVGWSIADHMRSELVIDALEMARWRRRPGPGAVVHSDRGSPVHVVDLRSPAALRGPAGLDGPGRLQRRQRHDRVLLVDDAAGTARPADLDQQGRSRIGDRRMDRGVLQPAPAPFRAELPQPRRVRKPSHRRGHRGMITTPDVPGEAGQAPLVGPR